MGKDFYLAYLKLNNILMYLSNNDLIIKSKINNIEKLLYNMKGGDKKYTISYNGIEYVFKYIEYDDFYILVSSDTKKNICVSSEKRSK